MVSASRRWKMKNKENIEICRACGMNRAEYKDPIYEPCCGFPQWKLDECCMGHFWTKPITKQKKEFIYCENCVHCKKFKITLWKETLYYCNIKWEKTSFPAISECKFYKKEWWLFWIK